MSTQIFLSGALASGVFVGICWKLGGIVAGALRTR